MHATVVPDVHAVVPHKSDPETSAAVAERWYEPKLRPEIVTSEPALVGAFSFAWEVAAGASKLNLYTRVPTLADTVTRLNFVLSVVGADRAQITVEEVVHAAVAHTSDPETRAAVGEKAYEPKFRPRTVTPVPPLVTLFQGAA